MTGIDWKVFLRALSWLWDRGNRRKFGEDMTKWSLWHKLLWHHMLWLMWHQDHILSQSVTWLSHTIYRKINEMKRKRKIKCLGKAIHDIISLSRYLVLKVCITLSYGSPIPSILSSSFYSLIFSPWYFLSSLIVFNFLFFKGFILFYFHQFFSILF